MDADAALADGEQHVTDDDGPTDLGPPRVDARLRLPLAELHRAVEAEGFAEPSGEVLGL